MGAQQSSRRLELATGEARPQAAAGWPVKSSHLRSLRKGVGNLLAGPEPRKSERPDALSVAATPTNGQQQQQQLYLVTQSQERGRRPETELASEMLKCNSHAGRPFASLGRRARRPADCEPTSQTGRPGQGEQTRTLFASNRHELHDYEPRPQNQQMMMQSRLMSISCNHDAAPNNAPPGAGRANCDTPTANNKQGEQVVFVAPGGRQPAAEWLPQQAEGCGQLAPAGEAQHAGRWARPAVHHVEPGGRRRQGGAVVMPPPAARGPANNSFASRQLSGESASRSQPHLTDYHNEHHHHSHQQYQCQQHLAWAPETPLGQPLRLDLALEPESRADEQLYYDDSLLAARPDFDLEHYYSRHLHLLEPQEPPAAQFAPGATLYAGGYPAAAVARDRQPQRRYKWPKQQYQYLGPHQQAAPDDYFDCSVAAAATLGQTQRRQRSRGGGGSGAAANSLAALFQQPMGAGASATFSAKHQSLSDAASRGLSSSKSQQTLNSAAANRSQPGGSLKRIKSSPLSAQQASYEAMRTIDMYLIRQIARNCRDFELEQKIDLEIRLRELAAQSMLEARTEIDLLEVEKSLLTSDQRMNCYAAQLEEQRKQLSNPSLSTDSGRGSKVGLNSAGSCNQLRQQAAAANSSQSASSDSVNKHNQNLNGAGGGSGSLVPSQQQHASVARTTAGLAPAADHRQHHASSPSFNDCSSSSQSPSKLSPVSGESANSPPSFSSGRNSNQTSRSRVTGNPLRQTHSSSNHSAGNTTLSRRQRLRHKRREQLMQRITSLSNINCNIVANNLANLSISELRIPLMWRDVDHFKQRGDYKRYAVFCLLKIDSQIYDTQLISDVDRQMTDLTFDDLIVFNNVGFEFELTLEVYSCVYLEHFSLSSTPRKLKEKLSSSVSRAMGRRLATQTASASYTKELQAYDKSYRFAMIASAKLRLDDASDSVKTYDLVLVTPSAHNRHSTVGLAHNSSAHSHLASAAAPAGTPTTSQQREAHKNTLPLFGHFCCKLLVRPDVFDKNVKTGYLRVASIDLAAASHDEAKAPAKRRQSADSPSGTSSSASTSGDSTSAHESSMLRSALAASSKLASLSMANSTVHWALLRNFMLHLWPIDEQRLELALIRGHAPQVDVSRKPPFSMMIDRYTKLLRVSNTSLTIETDRGCFVLAVYNPEASRGQTHSRSSSLALTGVANQHDEIGQWLRAIEQSVYDSHIWGPVLNHYPPKQQSSSATLRHSKNKS